MKRKTKYLLIGLLIIFFNLFLLTSCEQDNHYSANSHSKINRINNLKKAPAPSFFREYQLPFSVSTSEFTKAIGWLNNDEIVYMTNSPDSTKLYRYHLKMGMNQLLYKSQFPIVSAMISPDRKNILIHTSPTTYEGNVTVLSIEGENLYSEKFPSVEIVIEWNQNDPNQLLITTFKEDWSFTNYFLYLDKKELRQSSLRKPFAKWTGKDELAFLDWDENDISLVAPLVQINGKNDEEILEEELIHFDTFFDKKFTVQINQAEQQAIYKIDDDRNNLHNSYKVPVLTNYSGWLIPYYGLIDDQQHFLTMLPLESKEVDQYREGFQLVSFDLTSNKTEVILDHTENVPFTCSPNGKLCLIGYQLDQLLQLENHSLISLIRKSE
ncbi:hypothetical protein ACFSO7_19010 [Bacillus sp. CGMCC 1.16607]|uniref:YqgU-like beta propeller domain-containing protein n=1 Tax=Bacillus sp. CGMCC 1.16607 TaxID=3351842 RepID=UPI003630AE75